MAPSAAVAIKPGAGNPSPAKSSPVRFVDGGKRWVLMAISAEALRANGVNTEEHMFVYKVDGKVIDPEQVPRSVLQRAREGLTKKGDPEKRLATAILPRSTAELQMLLLQYSLS